MCDAACIKIIINTHFMSTLSATIISQTDSEPVQAAAVELERAADTYLEMLKGVGMHVSDIDIDDDGLKNYHGCDEAKKLVGFIKANRKGKLSEPEASEQVGVLTAMTDALWLAVSDLADGKLPGATDTKG